MSIEIFIHTVSVIGTHCRRCGRDIPGPVRVAGARVGVITAPAAAVCSSYSPSETDDAPPCVASPLVARIESLRQLKERAA